jgi:lambda family phage minor tail protein L
MPSQEHNSSLLDLVPDTIIELFEIDLGEQDGIYRFHPGIISTDQLIFGSKSYFALPVDASGFEKRADGQMARPTLTFANPEGLISDILKGRKDLVGKHFIRKRVFLKFLDAENFPNNFNPYAVPDSNSRFEDDLYIVNKKNTENKFFVEFELVSPLEFEDAKLPTRIMIANYCPWKYRGAGCRYGQRSNFTNPEQLIADKIMNSASTTTESTTTAKPSNVFIVEGSQPVGNLGLPLADENNKLFFEQEGYNIKRINWAEDYNNNQITVTTPTGAGSSVHIVLSVSALSAGIEANRTIIFTDSTDGTTKVPFRVIYAAEKGATSITGYFVREGSAGVGANSSGVTKYVIGDIVRIKSRFKNLSKLEVVDPEEDLIDEPDSFFVCIKDAVPSLDPRFERQYWVQDQCRKDLGGCQIRYKNYGKYKNGLPFGGFPSIESFRFR